MSKLDQLKEKIEIERKYLAECEKQLQELKDDIKKQEKKVEMLQDSLDIALEIAAQIRQEKDNTFREVMSSLFTSGKTDGDFATAFAEAHVSPPAELQLPSLEEKEADDDKESNEAA